MHPRPLSNLWVNVSHAECTTCRHRIWPGEGPTSPPGRPMKMNINKEMRGCARGTVRYFLHSFPSFGPPIIQSYCKSASWGTSKHAKRCFTRWQVLWSTRVLLRLWKRVLNTWKTLSEVKLSPPRRPLKHSMTNLVVCNSYAGPFCCTRLRPFAWPVLFFSQFRALYYVFCFSRAVSIETLTRRL